VGSLARAARTELQTDDFVERLTEVVTPVFDGSLEPERAAV